MLITPDMPFGKLHIKETYEVNPKSYKKIPCICDCGKEKDISICYLVSGHTKSCGRCNEISAEEMATKKIGKLMMKYPKSILPYACEKECWLCDCGNEELIKIKYVLSGNKTSCGRCNEITAEVISGMKFGKLRIEIPQNIKTGSNKKVGWLCDCGGKITTVAHRVFIGRVTSCGKCNLVLANDIKDKWFGNLKIEIPQDILPGSHKKIGWVCRCGNKTYAAPYSVISGNTTSCGRCNEISAEEMATRKFGKLRMKHPKTVKPGSHKKEWWLCDCGRETFTCIKSILSGNTVSCGRCNEVSAEEMEKRKFGRLSVKNSKDTLPGSKEKIECVCDCGNETSVITYNLFSGDTTSCGKCDDKIKSWYLNNKDMLNSLKFPINPNDFPVGGMIPLEPILSTGKPFKTMCIICGNIYHPRFGDIKLGYCSFTCGCSTNRVSFPQKEITEFIKSFNMEAINEHLVNKLKYDIFVPSHRLLIEYNGLKWHSYPNSKNKI